MLVVPLNTNRVSVFNLEADCPEYDDQSDVACGMLGTRNLVGTAFVVQLVLSFRSVLSGERVQPGEKPLLGEMGLPNSCRQGLRPPRQRICPPGSSAG